MQDQSFAILCVDDERSILNALRRLLRKEGYQLFFAQSGMQGLDILKANKIHLVISDQRMPEMNGTDFLAAVKDIYPDIIRVILTGYSDIDSITESINKGNIYKFFFKPWNDKNLKAEIRQILDQVEPRPVNRPPDGTIVAENRQLDMEDSQLDHMVEARTCELELQNHLLQFSHAILENLPLPVLGIDIEGVIVMANKTAMKVLKARGIKIGCSFRDCFPEAVAEDLRRVFETGEKIHININGLCGKGGTGMLLPLSGAFKGKGVIFTLGLNAC